MDALFFLNSTLLGVGLAMDAFSVSCADGLNEPHMKRSRMALIAGIFAVFQTIMPLLGWFCVKSVISVFSLLEVFIPWTALILLSFIGGKMVYSGIKNKDSDTEAPAVSIAALLLQGIATSIDALSVGFTVSKLNLTEAVIESLIIGAVTFIICTAGLLIGKKFGTVLSGKASVLGGTILIIIGLQIFIKGII